MLLRPLTAPAADLAPFQKLACAVIRQAILDEQQRVRHQARGSLHTAWRFGGWLRHDNSLRVWCHGSVPEIGIGRDGSEGSVTSRAVELAQPSHREAVARRIRKRQKVDGLRHVDDV